MDKKNLSKAVLKPLLPLLIVATPCVADVIIPQAVVRTPSSTLNDSPAEALFDGSLVESFTAERLNGGEPIIHDGLFEFDPDNFTQDQIEDDVPDGFNINGPSIIRVPDWIDPEDRANVDAVYYMYFAHHRGHHIRMAWSESLEGPWELYRANEDTQEERGVLGMEAEVDGDDIDYFITLGRGSDRIEIVNHIASPDVLVDDARQEIIMFFHAPAYLGGGGDNKGKTFGARSRDGLGLDFNGRIEHVALGEQYMRLFDWEGETFGSTGNRFWKSPNRSDQRPWKRDDDHDVRDDLWEDIGGGFFKGHSAEETAENLYGLYNRDLERGDDDLSPRHTDVFVIEDRVHVFYSCKGGAPEKIVHSAFEMSHDTDDDWEMILAHQDILLPELEWEGGNLPVEQSQGGRAGGGVRQLRDPDFFMDADGSMYLAYSGQGEDAIGLASLEIGYAAADVENTWQAKGLNEKSKTVVLDLGADYLISKVTVYPKNERAYQYKIGISDRSDGGFSTIVDRSDNTEEAEAFVDEAESDVGRYLKFRVLGAHGYDGDRAAIREIVIEGVPSS